MVSSYALDDGARLLLFDPLAVPEEILDLAADREPVVVLTAPWHRRDAQSLVERFGAPVFTPPPDTADDLLRKYGIASEQIPEGWLSLDVASLLAAGGGEAYRAGDRLPIGLEAFPGRLHNDLVLWIERVGALVAGERWATLVAASRSRTRGCRLVSRASGWSKTCGRCFGCRSRSSCPRMEHRQTVQHSSTHSPDG